MEDIKKKDAKDTKVIEKYLINSECKLANNELYWNHPMCPDSECMGVLTHYFGTQQKLLCLKCGNVYEMKFLNKEV